MLAPMYGRVVVWSLYPIRARERGAHVKARCLSLLRGRLVEKRDAAERSTARPLGAAAPRVGLSYKG